MVESSFTRDDIIEFLVQHANSLRRLKLENFPYSADDSGDSDDSEGSDNSNDSEDSGESEDAEVSEFFQWNVYPSSGHWKRLMIALAGLEQLNLHSIEIIPYEDSREVQLVDADALIRFPNNTGPSPFVKKLSYKFIATHLELEDEDFTLPAEYNINDLEHIAYIPQSYWQLRRLRNLIVWWDEDRPGPGNYRTERWLFERRDGAFAYSRDPWEYFSDWESDDGSDEGSSEDRSGDVVTETPFGPKFEAFCKVKGNGEGFTRRIDSDIWDLRFPNHAMVLLAGGNVMPWREHQGPRQKGESSWELVTRKPVLVRAEEADE